jgi:lipoate-protein ligase B
MTRPVNLHLFPVTPYADAWRWQRDAADAVRRGGDEALAMLQHPPVYTFGRRARPEHLLVPPAELRARGAEVIETNRGGDLTFHGPGQIVGYPILDLRARGLGPGEYVWLLEEVLLRTLRRFGVEARRTPGRPGVWTGQGKIAAIGVRIERGMSLHGFALNVDVDLSWFDAIVPCGITDASVTSMAQVLGVSPGVGAVMEALAEEFAAVFDVTMTMRQAALDRRAGSIAVAPCTLLAASQRGQEIGLLRGHPSDSPRMGCAPATPADLSLQFEVAGPPRMGCAPATPADPSLAVGVSGSARGAHGHARWHQDAREGAHAG